MDIKSALSSAGKAIKNLGLKELTPKESQDMMKNLVNKNGQVLKGSMFKPGTLLTYRYQAEDKSQVWDRTPFVMVLSSNSKYVLGLNFHWAPVQKRVWLVNYIIKMNRKNIRAGKPMSITYKKMKPAIKYIGLYPVIRLYLKKNISRYGVIVPDDMFMPAARLRSETFTGGKVNSTTLWSRAVMKAKSAKRKLTA